MRLVAAASLLLAGCSAIFGLDKPVLVDAMDDGALADSDATGVLVDAPPPDAPPSNACPASYNLAYMTSRYRVIAGNVVWTNAAQDCADDLAFVTKHTHLAVVTSDAEAAYLASTGAAGWLGLSDLKTEGTFRWVTAQPTNYPPATGTPWAQGEPDKALGQDCVAMGPTGTWLDTQCGNNMPALCECDDYANDPSRYGP